MTSPTVPNENYTFDDVGNRLTSHRSANYGYEPNQFNRLASTETANYVYDANGNIRQKAQGKELWRYAWDYENRLVSASTRKQTVRYKYDALGRRIQRHFVGGRENTKFVYDGLDVVMDDNSGVLTKYQNGLGIDNKLKLSTNGVSKYFLSDHLGSTNALTDSSGNILESTNYDSFGNATNQLSTRYAYTGREFDSFTGLHYYRARFYDAQLGRFISEDPIGFAGGDVNLFGYVWNNPIKLVDPKGTSGATIALGGGALIGGGALLAAAPPAAIVVGGAILIYGAWELGEWIAEQPWNPLTRPTPYPKTSCDSKPRVIPYLPPPPTIPGEKIRCTKVGETLNSCVYECRSTARFGVFPHVVIKESGKTCPGTLGGL